MPKFSPIGQVRTPFATTQATPNQGYKADAEGTIELEAQFAPGISDLFPGETILILWWADEADEGMLKVDRAEGKSVFATRSPARPNRIGITACEIISVEGSEIAVNGVDMVDGTLVLDLKPPLAPFGEWAEYADLRAGYEEK